MTRTDPDEKRERVDDEQRRMDGRKKEEGKHSAQAMM